MPVLPVVKSLNILPKLELKLKLKPKPNTFLVDEKDDKDLENLNELPFSWHLPQLADFAFWPLPLPSNHLFKSAFRRPP